MLNATQAESRRGPFAFRVSALLAGLLALVLFTSTAHAQGKPTKVMVDAGEEELVSSLEEAGASVVARRGSYLVMSVPEGPAASLLASSGVHVRNDFNQIRLSRQTILAGAAPVQARSSSRKLKLIQFDAPPVDADLDALRATGVEIVQYVPQNAYLVWAPDEASRSALGARAGPGSAIQFQTDYLPDHALARALDARKSTAQPVEITVQLFNHEGVKEDIQAIIALSDAVLSEPREAVRGRYLNMRVSVSGTSLDAIAQRASVVRVEPYVRPRLFGERQGQIQAGNLDGSNQGPSGPGYFSWLASHNFSTQAADYPVVVVVDDGVDNGTATPETDEFYVDGNDALASRILFSVIPPGSSASGPEGPDGHGHINASIVGGYNTATGAASEDSSGFNYGLGISPYGRMANVRIFAPGFDVGSGDATMVDDYYQRGARISTNSWGADVFGSYTTDAQLYDSLTRDARGAVSGNQELLFIFANGNAGPGTGSVGSPATAKNVLSVGASETSNPDASNGDGCGKNASDGDDIQDMASFSSRGPSDDGRIKPEIVAPGTFIQGNASQPIFHGSGVCGAATNNFSAPGTDALFPPARSIPGRRAQAIRRPGSRATRRSSPSSWIACTRSAPRVRPSSRPTSCTAAVTSPARARTKTSRASTRASASRTWGQASTPPPPACSPTRRPCSAHRASPSPSTVESSTPRRRSASRWSGRTHPVRPSPMPT